MFGMARAEQILCVTNANAGAAILSAMRVLYIVLRWRALMAMVALL